MLFCSTSVTYYNMLLDVLLGTRTYLIYLVSRITHMQHTKECIIIFLRFVFFLFSVFLCSSLLLNNNCAARKQ